MSEAVRDIVIAGGGLAGWYCAARLCHAMRGRAVKVRVLRAAAPGVAVDPLEVFCASTLPSVPVAHAELGIDERTFMRECDGTFKLATEYRGFDLAEHSYMLPLGEIGARIEAVGFHQFISRLMHSGRKISLDEFAVPSIASREGRFAHPTRDPRSVLSTYEYAYHLDTQAYTRMLRRFAEKLGAVAVDEDLARVEVTDGHSIRAIALGDGTHITADLYIDCTGTRAALLDTALHAPFESWRAWLPCDAALVTNLPAAAAVPSCTRALAQPKGWWWEAPLRSGGAAALIYDSHELSWEAAKGQAAAIAGVPLPEPRQIRFENGIHREPWRGNCVAMGSAAGFLEPLATTGLRLIDAEVTRLVALFPDRGDMRLMASEYNRAICAAYERARDFVLLHYLLSRRTDGALWRERAVPAPASLAQALRLFRHRGRVAIHEDEIFDENWWACACIGLGIRPERFSILAEQMSEADLLAQLAKIARLMRVAVDRLPAHRTYLNEYLA
jgi:tryptophan halogenase